MSPSAVRSETTPEHLTISEAADYLGVTPATLRNWDRAGKLRPHRHPMSRYRLYARDELDIMLKAGVRRERRVDAASKVSWDDLPDSDHFVLFYAEERSLMETLSSFVGRALSANEVAVVIATPDRRARLRRKLKASGFDMAQALATGQFVALDAQSLLNEIMVDGLPDPVRFEQLAGGLIDSVSPRGKVRGFGEMVSMLWAAGNKKGALQLEDLWNSLGRDRQFVAFCAYPVKGFEGADVSTDFVEVCGRHTHVIAAETFPGQRLNDEQQRAIAVLQQKAESLASEVARRALSEREFADYAADARDGLNKLDANGTILWANAAELAMLGFSAAEYEGRNIRDFHVDSNHIAGVFARLNAGEDVVDFRAMLKCQDGSVKAADIRARAYFTAGRLAHIRCVTHEAR